MTGDFHAMRIAERVYGVATIMGVDVDRLGEVVASEHRMGFVETIADNSSMTEMEVLEGFNSREAEFIDKYRDEWPDDLPIWPMKLISDEIVVESMIRSMEGN